VIARKVKDLEEIWLQLDRSKRFSGAVVRFGPFGARLKVRRVLRALATNSLQGPAPGAHGAGPDAPPAPGHSCAWDDPGYRRAAARPTERGTAMIARSINDLEKIWIQLDRSKWLTDNIIKFGPLGIGLNGLTALLTSSVPILGIGAFELFTVVVAAYLLIQAVRSRASAGTVLLVVFVLGLDALFDLLDFIPFLGGAIDAVFRGPLVAARILQKSIERTHWIEGTEREARASGAYARHVAEMHAQKKRRLVYLGDPAAGSARRGGVAAAPLPVSDGLGSRR
jgi:hypothetical protein